MRRNGETIALIPQPGARNRGVHREEQRVKTGRSGAFHQPIGDFPLPHDIQLEKVSAVRVRGLHILNRGGTQGGQAEWDAGLPGGGSAGQLALGLHEPGETRRGDTEREGGRAAEHLAAGIHIADIVEDGGVELHILECLAGPIHRDFVVGGTVRVVKGSCRGATLGDLAQVINGLGVAEARPLEIEVELFKLNQIKKFGWMRQLTLDFSHELSLRDMGCAPPRWQQ